MAPSIPTILQTPWPVRPSRMNRLRGEASDVRKAEQEENKRVLEKFYTEKNALREEKLAVCPRLELRLLDATDLSLIDGTLNFTATLSYTESPKSTFGQPIVLQLFGSKAEGPLSEQAVYWGQYQIFTSPENLEDHRVPFEYRNMSLRQPRDENGRFVEPSETAQSYVISEAEGWVELSPGQEVSRRVTLRLDQSAVWQRELRAGREYWLRWAPSGTVGNPKTLWSWKYGSLKDWEGVMCSKTKDSECWIAVPVKAEENGVKFKVVDGDK